MPDFRQVGGPGGRTSFQLVYNGARVLRMVTEAEEEAMRQLANRILARFRAEFHVDTGQMRDEAFADITVQAGRRTIRAGSHAPHTAYHELGTANYSAHPQIRTIMDEEIPTLLPLLRRILAAKGKG